ncbi:type IVB secretion system protein IcmV [Legionella londiniensis]|nr:type IVB secretion system protein IcmV [Legionella londiniensis]
MKRKFGSRITNLLKRVLNIKAWLDWDRLKRFTRYLGLGFKKLFIIQIEPVQENFEAAKTRFNLTESDLLQRQKALFRLSLFMIAIALMVFSYAVYQLYFANIIAFLLSLVVLFIALVLAFRYHYWYYLIKKRKLGCSLHEWFTQGLMGNKE